MRSFGLFTHAVLNSDGGLIGLVYGIETINETEHGHVWLFDQGDPEPIFDSLHRYELLRLSDASAAIREEAMFYLSNRVAV